MAPKNAPAVVKGTILCLHGFAQNGPTFSAKASGIRKALKKVGYHTVFIDGPINLTSADLPFDASKLGADDINNFKGWWYTTDEFDIKPAFESVKAAYEESGPFIGIMGFSQGSGLAAIALNNYDEIVGKPNAKDELKFGIVYSGFKVKPDSYQRFYQPKLEIPTLHIMGELDTLVSNDRSQDLADFCVSSTVFKHPGGHFVPNTKDLLKKEVEWVQSIMEPKEETTEESSTSTSTTTSTAAPKTEEAKKASEDDDLKKLSEQMDKLGTL